MVFSLAETRWGGLLCHLQNSPKNPEISQTSALSDKQKLGLKICNRTITIHTFSYFKVADITSDRSQACKTIPLSPPFYTAPPAAWRPWQRIAEAPCSSPPFCRVRGGRSLRGNGGSRGEEVKEKGRRDWDLIKEKKRQHFPARLSCQ